MNAQVETAIQNLIAQTDLPMADFRDAIIDQLCILTNSEIAYFYATDMSETHLTLMGYSAGVMAECAIVDPNAVYDVSATGLWGDAIRERKPVITNDYPNSKRSSKRGIPEGHVHITRHMNLPVFADGRIVAIVGVGNSPDPYTMDDADNMAALMDAVWTYFEKALWAAVW